MHLRRLMSALVFLPLFYLYVMKLPALHFGFLLLFAASIAQSEFYSMYKVRGFLRAAGLISGVLFILASYALKKPPFDLFILAFVAMALLRLFLIKDPSSSLREMSPAIAGLLYIPGLLSYQMLLRAEGPEWIIFLYGTVWASDSAAYYIGKSIGKRKLYREVSPNKTVAGAVASVAGGGASAVLLDYLLLSHISAGTAALTGAVIGTAAVAGDLVESMFKRDAGVKDSGSFIPGHGGILDKIDGVLLAGPVLTWMLLPDVDFLAFIQVMLK